MVSVQYITVTENLRTSFDLRFDDPEDVDPQGLSAEGVCKGSSKSRDGLGV